MSPQLEFLTKMIAEAKAGSKSRIGLLRQICVSAAEKMPDESVVKMAECLARIGLELDPK